MKVVACGYPPFVAYIQEILQTSDVEFKFFIRELISARGGVISQQTFRR